jgi:CRISPR/Cas system-associated exonuclease Cas4 (RecB family)
MTPFPKDPKPVVKGGLRPPVTWSYSVLTGFEACPLRHYHVRVARDRAERVSDANQPGQDAHRSFEKRIKEGKALPPGLAGYERVVAPLMDSDAVDAEVKIGLTAQLKAVDFFHPSVWCRVVVDVLAVRAGGKGVLIVDWKTGKPRDNEDQARLSCVAALAKVPTAQVACAVFIYTNHRGQFIYKITRDEMESVMDSFAPRVAKLEHAMAFKDWPATPGWACRFCPVKECRHNKTYD